MRSIGWLVVAALLLSPGLWLVWRHREQIEQQYLRAEAAPHAPVSPVPSPKQVSALGRLEPQGGIISIAGPSRFSVVVDQLLVKRGDPVVAGQLVATLDSLTVEQAQAQRLQAELAQAELELTRLRALLQDELLSQSELDKATAVRDMVASSLAQARAELERSHVRSPVDGRVLEVHARSGEKVGPAGIIEVADTHTMDVVAEVYETDIAKVKVGQRAVVRSPALPGGELSGVVRLVGLKVSRKDVLDSDPVADVDSRVVEVRIAPDSSEGIGGLTNLRVTVAIALEQ